MISWQDLVKWAGRWAMRSSYDKLIFISIPCSWSHVPTPVVWNWMQLFANPVENAKVGELLGTKKWTWIFDMSPVFPIDRSRNEAVRRALDMGADYMIFLDADNTQPLDALPRLLERVLKGGKYRHDGADCATDHCDIVSGLYHMKKSPHQPVSAIYTNYGTHKAYPICTDFQGLVECDIIGCGSLIVTREVLEKIGYPWFKYIDWYEDGSEISTEDVHFALRARQEGFRVWTDTTIQVGHVASTEITTKNWMAHGRHLAMDESGRPRPEKMTGKLEVSLENWPGSADGKWIRRSELEKEK